MLANQDIALTNEQRAAIACLDRSLLLMSPAGSGKTLVLSERAKATIACGCLAERTLALTFTNRAAEEMRRRMKMQGARISTLHSFCSTLIREYSEPLGIGSKDFIVADEYDVMELLGEVHSLLGQGFDGMRTARHVLDAKAALPIEALRLDRCPFAPRLNGVITQAAYEGYSRLMRLNGLLDFGDLIYYARALVHLSQDALRELQSRFDYISVDEAQDVALQEYEIIDAMARKCRSLMILGDFDQTIYTWRRACPDYVIADFRARYTPREVALTYNFRSTRRLVEFANGVAAQFQDRKSHLLPAPNLPEGESPRQRGFASDREEAQWVAAEIKRLRNDHPTHRIGVLLRKNMQCDMFSQELASAGINHFTADKYDFMRRAEVKDLMASLRLAHRPSELAASRRLAKRYIRGFGSVSLQKIDQSRTGVLLSDFLHHESLTRLDPYGLLIEAAAGSIVVFDVETTGLNPTESDVVEIAAAKVHSGRIVERFHRFIRPSRTVGTSVHVHGHTDDVLARKGVDASSAFADFFSFCAGLPLCGHNVSFDLAMVARHARRVGLTFPIAETIDTLPLAQRLLRAEKRHTLGHLVDALALPAKPDHTASNDVEATVQLMIRLAEIAATGPTERRMLMEAHARPFVPYASALHTIRWRGLASPPSSIIKELDELFGLTESMQHNAKRFESIQRMVGFIGWIEKARPALAHLPEILSIASLVKSTDLMDELDDTSMVKVITIHGSKGLEFDHVFLGSAGRRSFNQEEDLRLLYVAATRARTGLTITWNARDTVKGNPDSRCLWLPD